MKFLGFEIRRGAGAVQADQRAADTSPENPTVPVSAENFLSFFGIKSGNLPAVSIDRALRVPAVQAAVTFLPSTLANLPLHAFRVKGEGSERVKGDIQRLLNEAPNPEWTSFGWRKYMWQQVFTGGRGLTWIERSGLNPVAFWPMDPAEVTIKRISGRKFYQMKGKPDPYPASDVIDIPFMLKRDQLSSYSPIMNGSKAIQLALAMTEYAGGFFAGGGVPPLGLTGPLPVGADGLKRAMSDVRRAIDAAQKNGDPVFPIPPGYELKQVGFDPAKSQMTEAMRFLIEEFARLWNLPPVFLQDLSHGNLSNVEQQDLHLVKHLIAQWAKAFEEECNLKIFGQKNGGRYVEHNLAALMRGDFKSRIEALARGIQTAQITPNESRALDNRQPLANGDVLYIQGATVPLGSQPLKPEITPPETQNGGVDDPKS